MPAINKSNASHLEDSVLEFPSAHIEGGCFTNSTENEAELFCVSKGSLPLDRISFWKIFCHHKAKGCFPILGICSRGEGNGDKEAASYMDKSFFGWRSDASSWQGGASTREDNWVGYRSKQLVVFRYDPVSSPKTHFLSVQVLDTDIEATVLLPAPPPDQAYHLGMALDEGTQITFSKASAVDVRYWEIQQEILNALNEVSSHK